MLVSKEISAEQVRSARAYLGLSQDELADASGISRKSLYEVERGEVVHKSTLLAVRRTLEKRGVMFVAHDGLTGVLVGPAEKMPS